MKALRPITSRLSARLRDLSAFDDAVEVIEVDGPTQWELDEVIALPGEFDRLVEHSSNSTRDSNLARLTSRTMVQGPCRLHRVTDAIIADGTVLTKRSYQAIQDHERRWLLTSEPQSIDEGAICSTWVTERYFAHWLHDGLPHELLAISRGTTPLTLSGVDRPHEPGYRKLANMAAKRVSFARVQNLWLLEDWELSRSRAERLEEIVRRVRSHFHESGPERVFISRGSGGAVGRNLRNEMQIVETLERRGFAIVQPDELSPEQIAAKLVNARIVIGVEGSALGHALIAAPTPCGFLTIMGPRHFNMHYRPFTAARGIRLAYTIGDIADAETFTQPIDRLLKTIDLLDSAVGG